MGGLWIALMHIRAKNKELNSQEMNLYFNLIFLLNKRVQAKRLKTLQCTNAKKYTAKKILRLKARFC